MFTLLRRHHPDPPHCVAMKPVLSGGQAAILAGVSRTIRAMVARMLAGKGIGEAVETVRIRKVPAIPIGLRLGGAPSLSEAKLRGWEALAETDRRT